MKNDNNLVPVERLFVSYDKMKTEISLLQISLQNTVLDDEEIESMALSHPVGTNDCGKSSVFLPVVFKSICLIVLCSWSTIRRSTIIL